MNHLYNCGIVALIFTIFNCLARNHTSNRQEYFRVLQVNPTKQGHFRVTFSLFEREAQVSSEMGNLCYVELKILVCQVHVFDDFPGLYPRYMSDMSFILISSSFIPRVFIELLFYSLSLFPAE